MSNSIYFPIDNAGNHNFALRMVAHPLVLGVADGLLAPYCERIQLHIGMFRRLCPGVGVLRGFWSGGWLGFFQTKTHGKCIYTGVENIPCKC